MRTQRALLVAATACVLIMSMTPLYAQQREPPAGGGDRERDFEVTIRISGTINGQPYTATGGGMGSIRNGTLRLTLEFRSQGGQPLAFSPWIASMWTSSCSTPTFAVEQGAGATNMFTLSGGTYDCIRQIRSAEGKVLDYSMQVRTTGQQMTVIGTVNGAVEIPRTSFRGRIKEFMVPEGPGRVASLVGFRFGPVPVVARSEYRLPGGVQLALEQLRISEADVTATDPTRAPVTVTSIYRTTISPVP